MRDGEAVISESVGESDRRVENGHVDDVNGVPEVSGAARDDAFRANATTDDRVAQEPDRGRRATTPLEIPHKGWWDIARRVFNKIDAQNASILSAGIAFYAMLALFPALGAIVTTYALISDPDDVGEHFALLKTIIPGDVASIIDGQLQTLAARPQQKLGIGLMFGILFAIWSARRGIDALVRAVTVAYDERETRGLIHIGVLTYVMTLGAVMLLVTTIALLVALPALMAWLPLSSLVTFAVRAGGWLIFFGVLMFSLGVLYRYAPPRQVARIRWLSPGAFVATLLWIAGSAGFSIYVTSFGSYNETYGTLGAIIVLLLWFFLTAYSIVLGAALNAEMEHQTAHDTTVGQPKPMGERGAFVADTLGESAHTLSSND